MTEELKPWRFIHVPVGGGAFMDIPNPVADPHIEWSLRYSTPTKKDCCVAAELISSLDYLVSDNINEAEATRRLHLMRKARKTALQAWNQRAEK